MNQAARTIRNQRTRRKRIAVRNPFIVSPSYARGQMNLIKDALNSREQRVPEFAKGQVTWRTRDVTERMMELRRLIKLWEESNRNLNLLFRKHPQFQGFCTAGRTLLVPNRDGKPQLAWSPDLGDFQSAPQKREALRLFVEFLVNPLSVKLGGPCARCDDYYLQKRVTNKAYCKRQCGSVKTALAWTEASRRVEKNTRLAAAKGAVIEWENNPKGNWKELVAKRVSGCSSGPVTVKWVTRAVTDGKLDPPSNA